MGTHTVDVTTGINGANHSEDTCHSKGLCVFVYAFSACNYLCVKKIERKKGLSRKAEYLIQDGKWSVYAKLTTLLLSVEIHRDVAHF